MWLRDTVPVRVSLLKETAEGLMINHRLPQISVFMPDCLIYSSIETMDMAVK